MSSLEELKAQIDEEERRAKVSDLKSALYQQLTHDGCPEPMALVAALPYITLMDLLLLPKIHLTFIIEPVPSQIRSFISSKTVELLSIGLRALPQIIITAASSDVNGRVIPAVMGIGRPDAAQVAAIALAKIPWIVQVITETDGIRQLLQPFHSQPRDIAGRDSPTPDTSYELYQILALCCDLQPVAVCQFLGVNPTILAGLLSHVAVDAIADAFISMIKHILNASDANIAAVQWIADQFIPAILMAIRYHKGPHDGCAANWSRILVQIIGVSWRNRTFTKESIRLAGLPCLLPRHVAICQQVQLSQDLLQPIDRSWSAVLASLEVIAAMAERPDLAIISPHRFITSCLAILAALEGNYSGWISHTRRVNPRSSFDDELKDALWPLYSRLIVSVINVLYLALSHGSQEAIIAYYTPANRLPARLLEACVRHPLNNILHGLVEKIFGTLALSDRPDCAFLPDVVRTLLSYLHPPAGAIIAAFPVRVLKTPPSCAIGFMGHWQRIAGHIRYAASINHRLFTLVTAIPEWFEYVASGALDEGLEKIRFTDRSHDNTIEAMQILYGDGVHELASLEDRYRALLSDIDNNNGTQKQHARTLSSASIGRKIGSDEDIAQQREQNVTLITTRWDERKGHINDTRTIILRCSSVSLRGRPHQYNVLLAPNNSIQRLIDFSLPSVQRGRRVQLAAALRISWMQRINSFMAAASTPLPLSYKPFEWRDIQLCQMVAPSSAADPAVALAAAQSSPRGAAAAVAVEQKQRDCCMTARPQPSIDGIDASGARLQADFKYMAAAFTHFTWTASNGQLLVTWLNVTDERAGIYILDDCHIHTTRTPATAVSSAAAAVVAAGAGHGASNGNPFGSDDGGVRAIQEWITYHRNECRSNPVCQYLHQEC